MEHVGKISNENFPIAKLLSSVKKINIKIFINVKNLRNKSVGLNRFSLRTS